MQDVCHRTEAGRGPLLTAANCWRIERHADAEVLIDAADYFEHLYAEMLNAKEQVIILAWDIDTRVALLREDIDHVRGKSHLATLIRRLTSDRRDLKVHILCWKFAPIFILDREIFQRYKLGWRNVGRISFRYDDQHPITGSHHQKIVVIDDRVAYCGGLDLTKNRWDTGAHAPLSRWRINPQHVAYEPFHDTQIVVRGAAARHLGELCRERWAKATDETLPVPSPDWSDAPPPVTLHEHLTFRDITLGISRTVPCFKGTGGVREVQQLFSDMLRGAKRYIYIENQYITAHCISKDLAASLKQPTGPQIVIILPSRPEGLIERNAMFALQLRLIAALRRHDDHGRLHACCPVDAELPPKHQIKVHSKVMAVDDRWLRVGSANLNNRSMGLDTECDIVVDAGDSLVNRHKVRHFVAESASHFLSLSPAEVAARWSSSSLIDAMMSGVGSKRLVPVEASMSFDHYWFDEYLTGIDLLDPDAPFAIEQLFDEVAYEATHERLFRKAPLGLFFTAAFCIALGLLWMFSPLREYLAASRLIELLEASGGWGGYQAIGYVTLLFVVGGLVFFPLNLLIITFATLMPAWQATTAIMLGSLMSSLVGYAIGRLLKLPFLERLMPKYLHKVQARVDARQILPLVLVRLMPVAPFSLINLVAGAARVPVTDYLIGTTIGLLPGVVCLVFLQKSLFGMLESPTVGTIAAFLLAAVLLSSMFIYLQKRLTRYERGTA